MTLIPPRKVCNFHPVLRKLSQLQQTILKLFSLLTISLKLLELLPIVDLILQPPFHNIFPYFFNTPDKQRFHFVAFLCLVDILSYRFSLVHTFFLYKHLQVFDSLAVVRFKCLYVLYHLTLDSVSLHP